MKPSSPSSALYLVRGGKRFIRDEIVGVYEGFTTTDTDRPYVLGITRKDQETLYVDADPNKGKRISLFGKMNEDLHRGRYNAELGEDGFIRILEDCEDEELFTRYWGKYNWDFLKQRSLAALHKEISTELPGMEKLVTANWNALIMDKGQLSKWIRKLVDGNTKPNELHGIRCGIGEHPKGIEDLIGFLTYGPNSVRYHYKHWGHPFTPPTTNKLGKSRLEIYSQKWEGGAIINGTWKMLTTFDVGNTSVQELYGKVKKRPKDPKEVPVVLAPISGE